MTLAWTAGPACAQQPSAKPGADSARDADRSSVGTRTVTGKVKSTKDDGLVVVGRDTGKKGKEKEWAFVLDPSTRIEASGQARSAGDLKQGDPVSVAYTTRDGKVIAQSVTVTAR